MVFAFLGIMCTFRLRLFFVKAVSKTPEQNVSKLALQPNFKKEKLNAMNKFPFVVLTVSLVAFCLNNLLQVCLNNLPDFI